MFMCILLPFPFVFLPSARAYANVYTNAYVYGIVHAYVTLTRVRMLGGMHTMCLCPC